MQQVQSLKVFAVGEALPEWIGWAIVVGLGMVFAVIITIEVKIEEKYTWAYPDL